MSTDTANSFGPFLDAMEPFKAEALARGADEGLVNYLVPSAGMQAYVNDHNTRLINGGRREPLAYGSYEEFTLRHGQPFAKPAVARPKGLRKGRNKLCFMNAGRAAMEHDDWQYVEGYAAALIPVHHAWCLDADGNVVETTWDKPGEAYFGVVFPDEVFRRSIITTGTWGVFGIELLKAPYTPEAYMAHLRTLKSRL